MRGLFATILVLCAPNSVGADAAGLIRYDVSQLPVAKTELLGGPFSLEPIEFQDPYKSIVFLACESCDDLIGGQVAIYEDDYGILAQVIADFEAFSASLSESCKGKNGVCQVEKINNDGLNGFAIEAVYAGDFHLYEQTYFSNGLRFFISSHGLSPEENKVNVETLRTFAQPFVTGQKK